MKNTFNTLWIILLCSLNGFCQTTIPTTFYGINAWMPDSIDVQRYYGKLHDNWSKVETSGAKMVRIGGIAFDKRQGTTHQLLELIDSIKAHGGEPIVQVSLWGGTKTAAEAATLVETINTTYSRGVKYWAIGNEPNLVYNSTTYGFSSGNYTVADYATDVKTFSVAMKAKDPTIKVIAGELAWFNSSWINDLIDPNGSNDISGNNGTYDYIDYFSFHFYGFGGTQTRSDVLTNVSGFATNLTTLSAKVATANATHSRNNDLGFGVTEANITHYNAQPNEVTGVGTNSFIAGQWWVETMWTALEKGASFITFWSVVEGGDGSATDHGYISHTTGNLKPTYYHFQLMSKYFEGTHYPLTTDQSMIRGAASKATKDGFAIVLINYDESTDYTFRLRLNNDVVSGSEAVKINVNASIEREMTETIPAKSTMILFLSATGYYRSKIVYTETNASNSETPVYTAYNPTRAKKVFAHYLPWYDDGTGGYGRAGWCHEGDCADANNKSSVYTPLIDEYSQFDDEVLYYHIRLALSARIDGFIVNVDPTSTFQWEIFRRLCEAALTINSSCDNFDFKIIVSYDNSTATTYEDIITNFRAVRDSFYTKAAYSSLVFKDDYTNKPVLAVWSETNWTLYQNATDSLFGIDSVFVLGRNANNFDYDEGSFEWIGNLTNDVNNTTDWGETYFNDFLWITARQEEFGLTNIRNANLLKMGGVYPGFNDSNVPSFWNGGTTRYFARHVTDGETMELTWNKQINFTPLQLGGDIAIDNPWVQIITWNDFPEGTSIEPALASQYSFTALQTCRSKIATFKSVVTTDEDTLGMYAAHEIYLANKAERTADAATAATYFCNSAYENAYNFAKSGLLPVELLTFTGYYKAEQTILNWEVANFQNHSHFEIEYSTDGHTFQKIGQNDNFQTNYQFIHLTPQQGFNYYRLKIVATDGSFEYSKTIVIEVLKSDSVAKVYLNARQQLVLQIARTATYQVRIYNSLGQTVLHMNPVLQTGHHFLTIRQLPAGMYWVDLTSNQGSEITAIFVR